MADMNEFAAAKEEIERLKTAAISLMRAYDPNCDEWIFQDELDKMIAARESVDSLQELAKHLGSDPEGCLSNIGDDAIGLIESLRTSAILASEENESLRTALAEAHEKLNLLITPQAEADREFGRTCREHEECDVAAIKSGTKE